MSQRMFGVFYCQHCHRRWSSGNAWEGKGQQCKTCQRMVLPKSLRPLQPRAYNEDEKDRKPHQRNLCQKCQELGYNCQQYNPPPPRPTSHSPRTITTHTTRSQDDCRQYNPPPPRPTSHSPQTITTRTTRSQDKGCTCIIL